MKTKEQLQEENKRLKEFIFFEEEKVERLRKDLKETSEELIHVRDKRKCLDYLHRALVDWCEQYIYKEAEDFACYFCEYEGDSYMEKIYSYLDEHFIYNYNRIAAFLYYYYHKTGDMAENKEELYTYAADAIYTALEKRNKILGSSIDLSI